MRGKGLKLSGILFYPGDLCRFSFARNGCSLNSCQLPSCGPLLVMVSILFTVIKFLSFVYSLAWKRY